MEPKVNISWMKPKANITPDPILILIYKDRILDGTKDILKCCLKMKHKMVSKYFNSEVASKFHKH